MANEVPINSAEKKNLTDTNTMMESLKSLPGMLQNLKSDAATVQTIQQALISGDYSGISSLLKTELAKLSGGTAIDKLEAGVIARVVEYLDKATIDNNIDRTVAQNNTLSEEKQAQLEDDKMKNSTEEGKELHLMTYKEYKDRPTTTNTFALMDQKEKRDRQTFDPTKARRATNVVSDPEATETTGAERVTAENEEKVKATKKNIDNSPPETDPGIEVRDMRLQRGALNSAVDMVKRHVLGRDPSGHMHKHMYNSFKQVDVTNMVGFRRAHVFITTPNCNIFNKGVRFFNEATGGIVERSRDEWFDCLTPQIQQDKELANFICDGNIDVAMYLDSTTTFGRRRNVWCYPLMNLARNMNGLPNMDLKTRQGPLNFRNNYTEMVVNSADSISGNNVSFTFADDRECTVARMMYIWTKYAEGIGSGIIQGREARNKEIDYMCSIYVFVTDETNSELKFQFVQVGCFPRGRSYDYLSLTFPNMLDKVQISVPFKVTFPMDMNPLIPAMFNRVSAYQEQADKDVVLGDNSIDYDFVKGNAIGVNPLLDRGEMTLAGYFSDMFYITSLRPYRDPETKKMVTRLELNTLTKTDERGRIPYYLIMVNRNNKMLEIDPDSGGLTIPNSMLHPYTEKMMMKTAISEMAKESRKVTGNGSNIVLQKVVGDYAIKPVNSGTVPFQGPSYTRILDSRSASYVDKL